MPPHPSSSSEQLEVEHRVRAALERIWGLTFVDPPGTIGQLSLDAYAGGPPPVLVEIFAHVGRCKSGQVRKLSRDMTKLLLAEKRLGMPCRKVVAVVDADAASHFSAGWDGEFAREFGIETIVVPGFDGDRDTLRAVQARQGR